MAVDDETLQMLLGQFTPSPERVLAKKLRRQQDTQSLQQAGQKANSLNMLEFATGLSNNEPLAASTATLTGRTQKQYGSVKMGEQGFMLPESGDFVESPMFTDQKEADRESRLALTMQAQAAANQRAQEANLLRAAMGADRNATMMAIAGMRAGDRTERNAERAAGQADKSLDDGVRRLSTALEKANWPAVEAGVDTLKGTLSKHKEGELPGYGRFEGRVPDWAATNEMQIVRSDMQGLANIILKARSGAAVTEPEQVRFLREIGAGKGMSEEALRKGWTNVIKTLDAQRQNILAGANDDVLGEYNKRYGSNYGRGGAPERAAGEKNISPSDPRPSNIPEREPARAGATPSRPADTNRAKKPSSNAPAAKSVADMNDDELEAHRESLKAAIQGATRR